MSDSFHHHTPDTGAGGHHAHTDFGAAHHGHSTDSIGAGTAITDARRSDPKACRQCSALLFSSSS
jgi:hypothetical protein